MRPRLRRLLVGSLLTAALLLPSAVATAATTEFVTPVQFLPPVAPAGPGADFSGECGADGLDCVRFVEARLAEWEVFFGCDHRAVFATVYRLLTRETRLAMEADPELFDDPAGLGKEALEFYDLYDVMLETHLDGGTIPPAWQTAMDAAATGDWTAGHDMLLAINAHVQRDMPFAVAATGLAVPDGSSRKADHDRFNAVLQSSYPTIVAEVARRYDPFMGDVDGAGGPVDDRSAMQLVAGWREGVWRHAEELTQTDGTPLFDATVARIEANAEGWATSMSTGEVPGRRELRDAHCAAALADGGDGTPVPGDDGGSGAPTADEVGADGRLAATGGGASAAAGGAVALATWLRRRQSAPVSSSASSHSPQ